ncbi:MAG TPA: hypothetical protein PLO05_02820 [Bacteroidales bacterium]|jgi:hypothetical protein|nr:hypothetical protein [Bacteroidales bacterium]MDD4235599.1 hypothetical protein [Bacteroidales bacterium]MDY0159892.1 hypothetical protein [Bacteroidales bacterium]HRW20480.1 hypothetical protein [Bacteroidales bacterium]HXK81075.1 hypothetical protein [Bacteroidales bacterium]
MSRISKLLTIAISLCALVSQAQVPLLMNQDTDLSKSMNNLVPEPGEVVIVPNTNISIVPPEHFLLSEELPGFINFNYSSTIQIAEITGTSYVMISEAMTEEKFKEQNFSLIDKKEVELNNGQSGVLYRLKFVSKDGIDFERLLFFAGDYHNTICINVNFPAISHNTLYDKIEQSLLTAQYQ